MAEAYPNIAPYKIGSRGDKVKLIQNQLLIYYTSRQLEVPAAVSKIGTPDGVYGKNTAEAVKKFQNTVKILIDGKVGPNTWAKLFADPENNIPQPERIFKGKITNSDSLNPLEGVKISYAFDYTNRGETYSDKEGNFTIQISPQLYFTNGTIDWLENELNQNTPIDNQLTTGATVLSEDEFLNTNPLSMNWGDNPNVIINSIDVKSLKETPEFKNLDVSSQNVAINHLRIHFEKTESLQNPDGSTPDSNNLGEKYIAYSLDPSKFPDTNFPNSFIPLNGDDTFKFDLGDIYMVPEEKLNSVYQQIEDLQLDDSERKLLTDQQFNFIVKLFDTAIFTIRQKVKLYIFKLLKEFGINNPELILYHLKNFEQTLRRAEERTELTKLRNERKEQILKEFNAREIINDSGNIIYQLPRYYPPLGGINAPLMSQGFYSTTEFYDAPPETQQQIRIALSNIPSDINTVDLTNSYNLPKPIEKPNINQSIEISGSLTKVANIKEVTSTVGADSFNTNINSIQSTSTTIQNINSVDLTDKKLQSDIFTQLTIISSLGLIKINPKCPSEREKIVQIIELRNKLTTQINNIYKSISLVNKTITATQILINGFIQSKTLLLTTFTSTPAPASAVTTGMISAQETAKQKGLNRLDNLITKAQSKIPDNILGPSQIVIKELKKVIDLLSLLDKLIDKCAEDLKIPKTEIDAAITEAIIASSIEGNSVITEYNGFKLEIQEEYGVSEYKRRYAQALNKDGIVLIKGNPSFSSNDQLLINEVIFLIESKNLKAD